MHGVFPRLFNTGLYLRRLVMYYIIIAALRIPQIQPPRLGTRPRLRHAPVMHGSKSPHARVSAVPGPASASGQSHETRSLLEKHQDVNRFATSAREAVAFKRSDLRLAGCRCPYVVADCERITGKFDISCARRSSAPQIWGRDARRVCKWCVVVSGLRPYMQYAVEELL